MDKDNTTTDAPKVLAPEMVTLADRDAADRAWSRWIDRETLAQDFAIHRHQSASPSGLVEAAKAVLGSAERPGSRVEYAIGPEGEKWHDYQEVGQPELDALAAALAAATATAGEGEVERVRMAIRDEMNRSGPMASAAVARAAIRALHPNKEKET